MNTTLEGIKERIFEEIKSCRNKTHTMNITSIKNSELEFQPDNQKCFDYVHLDAILNHEALVETCNKFNIDTTGLRWYQLDEQFLLKIAESMIERDSEITFFIPESKEYIEFFKTNQKA